MIRPPKNNTHLGDGAYAWFDGFQIFIGAERENGWHYVALEPSALAALNRYARSVMPGEVE